MERIAQLHGRLLITISLMLVGLLILGLVCAVQGRVSRGLIAGLWVAELLIVAQGALGVLLLVAGGGAELYALHAVYGVVAALCLPGALAYCRGRAGRWEALTYVAVCVFLLGVLARAAATAG